MTSPATEEKRLLTVADVAARLNCSLRNVYELCSSGHLASLRVGASRNGLRILAESVAEFERIRIEEARARLRTA